ncbi:methyltransferase domain-containing protein, partial [Thioclava sp. BHET1]
SALFTNADRDLARAQDRKYDRILHNLGPEEDILEIGCGWGGFAERAADQGRRVTGITVSPAQKGYADARLDGRAEIRLQDYRDTRGRFSNIVSIEMIEAVGERFWPTYFATLRDRLLPGGQAMIQAITVPDANLAAYRRRSAYIR